ncbi:ubiquitin-protein transferase activating protein [Martiniozyma asiatica (nom. inval.)]|nr:ubiquitin-protein transferase activating protein [Martiniozyma asiatica]
MANNTTPKNNQSIFTKSQSKIFDSKSAGILSTNLNIVNSEWNLSKTSKEKSLKSHTLGNFLSGKKSPVKSNQSQSLRHHRRSSSTLSFTKHRTYTDLFNDKYTQSTSTVTNNKGDTTKVSKSNSSSPRKLRRTATNEFLDRFIPSRQTTNGKLSHLTLEKTKSLPSFALPCDHIESQTSQMYQSSVAEACGLEVGQRILQFQPAPPEANPRSDNNGLTIRKTSSVTTQFKSRQQIPTTIAQARMKKIPTCPEKVLDAPGLIDDFYLSLVAWSGENLLAIALDSTVYCWNATTGAVDIIAECDQQVTSIRWSPDGYYLSIGLDNGNIEIWDMEAMKKLRTMSGHTGRVAAHCWNDHLLTSGSRTAELFNNDVRIGKHIVASLDGHLAEVCGVEWRNDGMQLATGGNDNLVNIWDARLLSTNNSTLTPLFTKRSHNAAVKALSWCPMQNSLLATGGGSSCKQIHFWNTTIGSRVNTIQTDSQVSSLHWGWSNGVGKEILSTHGFPNNEISLWSYPTLQKTGVILDAHDCRILNSCVGPEGDLVATVSSDENLKFWRIWDVVDKKRKNNESKVSEVGKAMTIR